MNEIKDTIAEDNKNKYGDYKRTIDKEVLGSLESKIRSVVPYVTYDVGRIQGRYFQEFTYSDMFAKALFLSPQNTDAACEIVDMAIDEDVLVDETFILDSLGVQDKYILKGVDDKTYKSIAFLPGSNCLWKVVSRHSILRAIHEDPDLVIKPHPLTNNEDMQKLKMAVGIERLLPKDISGVNLLRNAENIYTTSTSTLGIAASLLGKNVNTVADFEHEHNGAFYPLTRYVFRTAIKTTAELRPLLLKALANKNSGVFYGNVTEEDIRRYYEITMSVREKNKPRTSRYYYQEMNQL